MSLHARPDQTSSYGPRCTKRLSAGAIALCIVTLAACNKTELTATTPSAPLGQSTPAQQIFHRLEQSWREGGERDQQLLEPRLLGFVAAYPNDPDSRQVELWLGWLSLSKRQFNDALARANQASAEKDGAITDAARVLEAAVFTRRGQPAQALRLLEPLSGMIVDPVERDNWAREIIRATMALKHDDDALKWALVWRLECSEDRRSAIEREITNLLDRVSRAALERLWVQLEIALQLPTSIPGRKQARGWMRSAVTERLARFAIYNQDASLAQRLLYDSSVSLQKNVSLRRLARIAARAETETQSVGRKIGIVLDLDDAQQRRRSSEIVTGILQTLGEKREKDGVQLLTREASRSDATGYEEAVNDLYNEGVAMIIGGFDVASAIDLVSKARLQGITVVTLAPLAPAERSDQTFFVNTSDQTASETWRKHLHSDSKHVIEVNDNDPFCSESSLPPFVAWERGHVEQVYFACGSSCAEKFGYAAVDVTHLPEIWLGPKALAGLDAWQSHHVTGAVMFEPSVRRLQDDPLLDAWIQRFSRMPHYYEALGHDLSLLMSTALSDIQKFATSNAFSRAEVLTRVSQELHRARAQLWTSTNSGFSSDGALIPTFAVKLGSPSLGTQPLLPENHVRAH